jgi:hypothetical protein
VDFFAFAPTDTNTILLPVLASRLGLTPAHPRFEYEAFSFDALSESESPDNELPGVASFNAFDSAISTGQFVDVAPNTTEMVDVFLNPTEAMRTPAKGLMVVTQDNVTAGGDQAQLIDVPMGSSSAVRAQSTTSRLTSHTRSGPARPTKLSPAR